MVDFSILPNVGSAVDRVLATAQNGLEVLRLGGLETGTKPAPFQVVETENMFRLRRYFPDDPGNGPHVILVPPMMVSANVYDVTEHNGAVSILREQGITPWVVDFGSPDREEGGRERTLADHIVAVSRVVDIVREIAGHDIHLAGYSQGGMFAYQTAAYRRSEGIASLITFGSPVDVLGALPLGLPANIVAPGAELLADKVFTHISMPSWMARAGFQLVDPVKTARSRIDFLRRLHDRDALLPREDQRRFIEADGWVAWSGPAIAELLRQFVVHNRMVSGGFVINGDLVSLAEITCPVLAFVGEADDIGQPKAVRGILRAAPSAEVYESRVPVGHFGLVVGSTAGAHTWPTTADWINWHAATGERPDRIEPMREVEAGKAGGGVSLSSRVTHGLGAVADAGTATGREVFEVASSLRRTSLAVAQESVRTVPRLFRLGQIQSGTRISLGKLMSENNRRSRNNELFLFENRVLTHSQVNTRIDNVVAGLIECGVRPGQHLGVLMDTRPSALVVVAALSRIGAVAVMLSGEWNIDEMLRLADARVVITDPSHLELATAHSKRVLVLGGGSGDARAIDRADGDTVIDMEQIDPAAVTIPSWFRADPGLAGDLAFILFTRAGGELTKWPITNHRFAMSAFGAASAAGLTSTDTVYCLPPLHHASGLLTTLGATVAGRSRIALSDGVDAETFTTEVHRYGVTVVSYTWSMMREIIRSPRFSINQHNPIRLFMGSGMTSGMWEEVIDGFPRAKVLEFFATADGSAILANVSGDKIGSMGKPLPETNPVQIAAVDPEREALEIGSNGYVRRTDVDEVGVMLSRARQRFESSSTVLRDVFASHDRWELSGHLFREDSDGDYWYMGTAAAMVRSKDGNVFLPPIEDALSRVRAVDQVVAYSVGEPGSQLAIAAITTRPAGEEGGKRDSITVTALRTALGGMQASLRPHIIHVVDEIPISESYRPLWIDLARRGVPTPGTRVWYRDSDGRYRRYTKTVAAELQWG